MPVAFAPAGSAEEAAGGAGRARLASFRAARPRRQLELPEGTVVPRFSLLTLRPRRRGLAASCAAI